MANDRLTVRALIVDGSGKILVLRRSLDDEDVPGRVDFPGGGVESGESYVAAIAREVEEEAGLNIPEDKFELVYSFTRYYGDPSTIVHRLLYIARVTDPTIRLSHEHDTYWWRTPDETARLFADISWSEALKFIYAHNLLNA